MSADAEELVVRGAANASVGMPWSNATQPIFGNRSSSCGAFVMTTLASGECGVGF